MSRPSARLRNLLAAAAVAALGAGCWEQVSPEWFAQMKQQPALQAQEGPDPARWPLTASLWPLTPPEGTIPLGGIEPRIDFPVPAFAPEAMALPNPIPATPASIERGQQVYTVFCAVCHGADGMANPEQVPVAQRMAAGGAPPLPLVAVPAYTDGFLFTKIRYGKPMMPGYPQIPAEDRWHVVNYLRTLIQAPAGAPLPASAPAPTAPPGG